MLSLLRHTTIRTTLAAAAMLLIMLQAHAVPYYISNSGKSLAQDSAIYDFGDSTLLQDENAFRYAFMCFVHDLQRLQPAKAATASRQAAMRVSTIANPYIREKAYRQLDKLAHEVLADTLSPQHDALLYNMLTKTLNLTIYADMAQRNGNTYMEKNLKKNMPGMPAADFAFIDRNGKRHSLHKVSAKYILLFFYDPDCHVCHDIAAQMAKEPLLADGGDIKVLAIYTDNETERWKAHASSFPESWTDGYSPGGEIAEKQPFYLPVIPSLYLLDADKRVLLRDVSPETLIEVVEQLKHNKEQHLRHK